MPAKRLVFVLAFLLACPGASPASARGFEVTNRKVVDGLKYTRVAWNNTVIHVATAMPNARVALRAVRARNGRETTSSMCKRVNCLAAINGDFFNLRTGKVSPRAYSSQEPLVLPVLAETPLMDLGGRPLVGAPNPVLSPLAEDRQPRTLLGRNPSGQLFLAVVDGRQSNSQGVTLVQAIRVMQKLGATEVINLDGGGSSTFVLRGRVVNRPSDARVIRGGIARTVKYVHPGDHVLARYERRVPMALALVKVSAKDRDNQVAKHEANKRRAGMSKEKKLRLKAASSKNGQAAKENLALIALLLILLAVRSQNWQRKLTPHRQE